MKRLLVFLCLIAFTSTGFAVNYYWTNAVDQDFGTFGNWNTSQAGTGTIPTTLTGNGFYINRTGSQRAVISSNIADASTSGAIRLGTVAAGSSGELYVSGGNNAFGSNLQVGGNVAGHSLLTMTDGTLKFNASYATIAEGTTGGIASKGTMIMTGGTFEADRMTIANNAGTTGTLDISAGHIKFVNYMGGTSSGSLRFGSGNATMNISGTAKVEMALLTLGNSLTGTSTGIFTMSGGELFTGDVAFVSGVTTAFEGGIWTLGGDKAAKINEAILNGFISHSGGNNLIGVTYNGIDDVTVVNIIPEPATVMLLGLGGLLIRKKK